VVEERRELYEGICREEGMESEESRRKIELAGVEYGR